MNKRLIRLILKVFHVSVSGHEFELFAQITDVHISRYADESKLKLERFCEKVFPALAESGVGLAVITGDLVDSLVNMGGIYKFLAENYKPYHLYDISVGPAKVEWTALEEALRTCFTKETNSIYGVDQDTDSHSGTLLLTIRGNHDCYSVTQKTDYYRAFFLKHIAPTLGLSDRTFCRRSSIPKNVMFSCYHEATLSWAYGVNSTLFLGLDICETPSPNSFFFGTIPNSLLIWLRDRVTPIAREFSRTVVFSHYPLGTLDLSSRRHIRDFLESISQANMNSQFWLGGHLHSLFGAAQSTRHKRPGGTELVEFQLPDFKISGLVRVYKVTEKTGNVSFVDSSVDSHLTLLRGDLPSGEYTEFRTDELSPIISYRKFHQKVLEFLFREMYVLSLVSVVLGSSICGLFLYSIHRSLRNHSDNFCGDMNLLISIKDFILLQVLWTPFIIWGFSVSTGNQLCIFSFAVTYCIENVCESFWRGRIFLSLDTLSCSLIIAGNIFPLILTRYIIWRALVHKPIRDISINRGDTSESSGYIVTTVIWITGACLILVSVIIHCISFKAFLMKSGWTAIAFCPLGYQAHMYFWFTISRYALSCRHSREKQKSD